MIHLWRMLIYSQMINCFKRKMQQIKNVFAFLKRAHKLHLSSLDIGHEVIKIFIVIFLSNIFFYSQSLFKLCNQHYGLCSKNCYSFHPLRCLCSKKCYRLHPLRCWLLPVSLALACHCPAKPASEPSLPSLPALGPIKPIASHLTPQYQWQRQHQYPKPGPMLHGRKAS